MTLTSLLAVPFSTPEAPDGFTLVRYEVAGGKGVFTPPIPVDVFPSLQVWIPDLGQWVKPKWLIGDADRWFAVKDKR